jgi:hypothetical protein
MLREGHTGDRAGGCAAPKHACGWSGAGELCTHFSLKHLAFILLKIAVNLVHQEL